MQKLFLQVVLVMAAMLGCCKMVASHTATNGGICMLASYPDRDVKALANVLTTRAPGSFFNNYNSEQGEAVGFSGNNRPGVKISGNKNMNAADVPAGSIRGIGSDNRSNSLYSVKVYETAQKNIIPQRFCWQGERNCRN